MGQILPNFHKIPNRLLSDNGVEFNSKEFNDVLDSYHIVHVYSSPYTASFNGCVERCNRWVIQLLKGINEEERTSWDSALAKALVVYNNSIHSQTGKSPSQFIMEITHTTENNIPIDKIISSNWKEGHPKFSPFKINQKVLQKVQKIGTQVKDKLSRRYDGPFVVVKVQSNEVTYELKRSNILNS